jgi:hypothetical protein
LVLCAAKRFELVEDGVIIFAIKDAPMIYSVAAGLALILSFIVFVLIALWNVMPWLGSRSRGDALIALLWVHAFRYIALQIFSAQKFGFAVSDSARNQIAWGDVIGAILAICAIIALRYKARIAVGVTWLFAAQTVLDLANSTIAGVTENLFDSASGVTWLILTFYVPILWISLGLIVWQLLRRRVTTELSP